MTSVRPIASLLLALKFDSCCLRLSIRSATRSVREDCAFEQPALVVKNQAILRLPNPMLDKLPTWRIRDPEVFEPASVPALRSADIFCLIWKRRLAKLGICQELPPAVLRIRRSEAVFTLQQWTRKRPGSFETKKPTTSGRICEVL
jgi:hypothetical protein